MLSPGPDGALAKDLTELPVAAVLPEVERALADHGGAVLSAPPGSGKTTGTPLFLLDCDWLRGRSILILEPRRLAARAAARRMAALLREPVGERVGYQVRFDRKIGSQTRIEVLTEGILTRRLQTDPALSGVGLVIFDEFHERSLHADLALALCLDARQAWCEDLRVLVMSATVDAAPASALLGEVPVVEAGGRSFPVTLHYRDRPADYHDPSLAARTSIKALEQQGGDVLTFLPGAAEIRAVARELEGAPRTRPFEVCPLYGELPAYEQDRAILRRADGARRIVLSTNIAQTSLTIEGVGAVVDTGLARQPRFDSNTGLSRLVTVPISRASAAQRAGRAGRLGPGYCWRLWTEAEHGQRPPFDAPEMASADLSALVLELCAWGVAEATELAWLSAPPAGALAQAGDLLRRLGALDEQGRLTALGKQLTGIPVHPRLGRIVLASMKVSAGRLGCDIAALLQGPDIVLRDSGRGCDLDERLEALGQFRRGVAAEVNLRACRTVDQVARQLARQVGETSSAGSAAVATGALLLEGFPDRLAKRRGGSRTHYQLSGGRAARLSDADRLGWSEYLVVPDLDAGRGTGRIYRAAALSRDDLNAYAELHAVDETAVGWNVAEECVHAKAVRRVGRLELSSRPLESVDEAAVLAAMLEGIRVMGLAALPWCKEQLRLRARAGCVAEWLPEANIPALDDAALLADLESWLGPFLTGMTRRSHLQRIDLASALDTRLPFVLRKRLDELAPTHYVVPSGSRVRIEYQPGAAPVLAVKLQEMFGAPTTPTICAGKVPLLIHLLSPAGRPLQITRDLAAFWRTAYPDVRKEMRGRYPKHPWPEDPETMRATRLTKRALRKRGN